MKPLTHAAIERMTATVTPGWHTLELRRLRKKLAERDEECHAARTLLAFWQDVAEQRLELLRAKQRPIHATVKVVQFEHQRN